MQNLKNKTYEYYTLLVLGGWNATIYKSKNGEMSFYAHGEKVVITNNSAFLLAISLRSNLDFHLNGHVFLVDFKSSDDLQEVMNIMFDKFYDFALTKLESLTEGEIERNVKYRNHLIGLYKAYDARPEIRPLFEKFLQNKVTR